MLFTNNKNYNFDLEYDKNNSNICLFIRVDKNNQLQLIIQTIESYTTKIHNQNINELLFNGENIFYLSFYKNKILLRLNTTIIFDETIDYYVRKSIENVYLYKNNNIQFVELNKSITPLDNQPPTVATNFVVNPRIIS